MGTLLASSYARLCAVRKWRCQESRDKDKWTFQLGVNPHEQQQPILCGPEITFGILPKYCNENILAMTIREKCEAVKESFRTTAPEITSQASSIFTEPGTAW